MHDRVAPSANTPPHRAWVAPWLCMGTAVLVAALYAGGFVPLRRAELSAQDFLVRYGRKAPADPRLVYLGIDQASLTLDRVTDAELAASPALQMMKSGWPWSRALYPLIVERVLGAGARVVAIDLLFPTPRDGDAAFRAALEQYRDRLVVGSNFDDSGSYQPPADSLLPQSNPLDDRAGFVNFWPDELDGIVRSVQFQESIEHLHGKPPRDDAPVFASFAARIAGKAGVVETIPAGLEARAIRFAPSFERRSAYEMFVPSFWNAPAYTSGEFFRGKFVVLGPEGNWGKDYLPTPRRLMSGTELHLQALNAALHGQFLAHLPPRANLLLMLLAGLFAWALGSLVTHPLRRLLSLMALNAAWYGAAQALYNYGGTFIPLLSPLVAMNVGGILWLSWEQVLERIERARTRRTLERYVSKNLVQEILDNPASYLHAIGGSRQNVTVLFSDLRGFTTLTESAECAALVTQLNEYFSEMVRHVFEQRGTLDKFIGDAIMAVWGNVRSEGPARDTELAVTAALRMLDGLARLNERWKAAGKTPFAMGIGINHGEAIVGNIGSHEKMDLTVIGDTVNIASRLEGTTKEYGVSLLLGETAAALVRDKFRMQLVDRVQVKGKAKAIDVFTVVRDDSSADYLRHHEEAVRLYREGRFAEAADIFEQCLALRPSDPLATLYIERCRVLSANPPPSPWDGVFQMKRK
jgi:adenylate cyclase